MMMGRILHGLHGHNDNDGPVPHRPDDDGPLPHCPGISAGEAAGEGEKEGRGRQEDSEEEGSIGWRTMGWAEDDGVCRGRWRK